MSVEEENELLKSHLGLCTELFAATCEQAGIDVDATTMNVCVKGETLGKMPIGKMLEKWRAMAA